MHEHTLTHAQTGTEINKQPNRNKIKQQRHTPSILTDYQFLEAWKPIYVRAYSQARVQERINENYQNLAAFFLFKKKEKLNKKRFSKYLNGNFSYAPHAHIAIRSLLERDTFQFLRIFHRFVISYATRKSVAHFIYFHPLSVSISLCCSLFFVCLVPFLMPFHQSSFKGFF